MVLFLKIHLDNTIYLVLLKCATLSVGRLCNFQKNFFALLALDSTLYANKIHSLHELSSASPRDTASACLTDT